MKFSLYPMLVAGLLIIGGCKSPMFESALNMHKPAAADLNPVEGFRQTSHDENGSIRPASFETLAQEPRQQSSPPGRVAIEDYLRRGHIAGRQGRIEEAKKFYDLVLRTDPDNVTAHHRLAVIADKQQNFQTAERHYQTALRHRPYDSDLLADIGYSYFLQKRFEDSEQYLSKALQSNPSHLRTLNNLGLLYGTLGDYDRALEMLRRTGSESEAREKLAKIFPRAEPRMQFSGNNPENTMFSSSGGAWNGSPVSSPFSTGSQLSNPFASRELTAPNPRGVASRNSRAGNPRIDQFRNGRELLSPHQENFDSTRTVGNSANPFQPAAHPTIDPNLPTNTYGGFSGGIDVSWPQPETQPLGTTRLPPNQIMPQQYQPSNTFPQRIPTDVRPVQEQTSAPNRLLPAPAHAEGQTQLPYGGFTNSGNQDSYQATSTSGSFNEPINQVNPVYNGFPEYQNQQPYNYGTNPTQPYAIPNPNGSISNPLAPFPSFHQLPPYNRSGTTVPNQGQG
ncbi:MAG: tetratricopeptide repeat protein, partial [Planctomycetes bacterium]|nr:tetratricopeptide repeat protein [Planctomycetota bacterium]